MNGKRYMQSTHLILLQIRVLQQNNVAKVLQKKSNSFDFAAQNLQHYSAVGKGECKQNLVEQKTCRQSFMIYLWDLPYSAEGNSLLSHAPRTKLRTTAEIPLKEGQQAAEKTKFLFVLYVVFVN